MTAPLDLTSLRQEAFRALDLVQDLEALDAYRVGFLGKKGKLTEVMQGLREMSPEEKRTFGAAVNVLKDEVTAALTAKKEILEEAVLEAALSADAIDITLPVEPYRGGCVHPLSQVFDEVVALFAAQGFTVASGPHIEEDFYNFTALNIPEDHPSRQQHDTFYLPPKITAGGELVQMLLRTQTSPVQVRTMRGGEPPFRIIAPGRVFRADDDATHSPMFHQIEGLVIDKNIHMGHLKACLETFLKAFFNVEELPMRFRPNYFPFTEPSAEVDIGCRRENGKLILGEGGGWLEILGCGMVHPEVLRHGGLDPSEWQGFAFGMGLDRLTMLKYGIPDLRTFFTGDVDWLRHYGFSATDIPSPLLTRI